MRIVTGLPLQPPDSSRSTLQLLPEGQQNAVFNPQNAAKYGRQLGAKYFITGKVSGNDERSDDMRRVQYFLFLQVIDVETSAIKWQRKTYITKAIK